MTAPRRGGLGRGLDGLISDTSAAGSQGGDGASVRYREVPLDAVVPNPAQPREHFDEEALAELVTSIREVGLLQPVVVRETEPGRFELVMGERRWRACRAAGWTTLPALVRSTGDEAMLRDALLENLHRQDLNPLEEAAAYGQLLADFGATHSELADRLGRSRSQVSNTLRLLQLPPGVQRRVAAGVLSAGHARALLGVSDPATQERLAARIVAEGLSVRAVEEEAALSAGDPATSPVRRRTAAPVPTPELEELSEALSDRFDTRVSVTRSRARGRIVVEFATQEDLPRILAVMAPDARAGAPGAGSTPGPGAV